jgi:hypothetical protein
MTLSMDAMTFLPILEWYRSLDNVYVASDSNALDPKPDLKRHKTDSGRSNPSGCNIVLAFPGP